MLRVILVFFFSLLLSCSGGKKPTYNIGVDPSWYPLDLAGQQKLLLAFSIELLQEISREEKLQMAVTRLNWDNLLWALREKKTDAVLSTVQPYVFYQKKYVFSDPYLLTGSILIVPENSKYTGIDKMVGKEIGLLRGSSAAVLLQRIPGLILRAFDSIPETLNNLEAGHIDGALIDAPLAMSYIRDLYHGKLKIVGNPIGDQGLRLVSLHTAHPILIDQFNKGLALIKKNGKYEQLLKKWGLSSDTPLSKEDLDRQVEAFLQLHF